MITIQSDEYQMFDWLVKTSISKTDQLDLFHYEEHSDTTPLQTISACSLG